MNRAKNTSRHDHGRLRYVRPFGRDELAHPSERSIRVLVKMLVPLLTPEERALFLERKSHHKKGFKRGPSS
ncbi:MAG: hypothetical protein ACREQ5_06060 [Candidatus Dormibacteria bacterium]